jgi:hypothetical protein
MLHINQFVDRVKAADSRQQRDLVMSMSDAKNLHADITKLLLALHTLNDTASTDSATVSAQSIEVDGGSF